MPRGIQSSSRICVNEECIHFQAMNLKCMKDVGKMIPNGIMKKFGKGRKVHGCLTEQVKGHQEAQQRHLCYTRGNDTLSSRDKDIQERCPNGRSLKENLDDNILKRFRKKEKMKREGSLRYMNQMWLGYTEKVDLERF